MSKQECQILPETDRQMIYLFYCKCRKSDGNPIIIKYNGIEHYAKKVKFRNVGDMELEFNNSPKKIAQRGATTVLKFDGTQYNLSCLKLDDTYLIKGKFKQNFVVEK